MNVCGILKDCILDEIEGYKSRGLKFSHRHNGRPCHIVSFWLDDSQRVLFYRIKLRLLEPVGRDVKELRDCANHEAVRLNIEKYKTLLRSRLFWAIEKTMVGDGRVILSTYSLLPGNMKNVRRDGCYWRTGCTR